MAEYRLYCFAQSGNAYKAALMLNLAAPTGKPRFVDFFNGETRTPEFRKINEMGEVPVWNMGPAARQSGVILDWLAARPAGSAGRARTSGARSCAGCSGTITSSRATSATLRFLLQFQKTGETPVTEFLRGRVTTGLGVLDRHLDGREFVLGARPTIADISICGYLFWPTSSASSWSDYPPSAPGSSGSKRCPAGSIPTS